MGSHRVGHDQARTQDMCQGQGPTLGSLAAAEAMDVSVLPCGCGLLTRCASFSGVGWGHTRAQLEGLATGCCDDAGR